MGRREQKERERKRAAAACQSLEKFLPRKKRTAEDNGGVHLQSAGDTLPTSSSVSLLSSESTAAPIIQPCSHKEVRTGHHPETCHQHSGGDCTSVDIGDILSQAKSSREFCKAMQALTIAQKYYLLTNHKQPHKDHVFPTQYFGGCNRSFRHVWLSEHPWMVYSEQVDGAFCVACAIFCADPSKGKFVTEPFRVWNKKSEKVKEHERCLYHQSAMEQADRLKQNVKQPHTSIVAHVDAHKAANIKRNRAVLMSIARAVLLYGRQCIALRGDTEKLAEMDSSSDNPGNFLALLKLLAVHDDVLRSHLETPSMRCATYVSPLTQNELIAGDGKAHDLAGHTG